MANLMSVAVYRINNNDQSPFQTQAFSPVGIHVYPTTVVSGGVQMNAVIEILPTGLNQQNRKYYTPLTVAAIITAAG